VAGTFNIGGLVSGMDTGTLITQLMQIESQPLFRLEDKLAAFETQREAVRTVRTQLTGLRNRAQDFRFNDIFDAHLSSSSEETVLTAEVSSSNPSVGSFAIDVTNLASATEARSSAVLGGNIDINAALDNSGIAETIQAGAFTINGQTFSVDPASDSLQDIIGAINANTAAGVTASYDAGTDKLVLENTAAGDGSIINLGTTDDDSNLLRALNLTSATQSTNANGATELTSTTHLGAVSPGDDLTAVNFAGGAVTAGTFSINGISISIDPAADSLSDVISRINNSDAGVSASYDSATDTIRVISGTLGSRTINFGATGDTSNFLAVANLDSAVQTAGEDAQFTVNGIAYTRNTNEVSNAVSGVTLRLLSKGESTVTVSSDDDTIVGEIQEFITEYNASLDMLRTMTGVEGDLNGDGTLRSIENFMRSSIFNRVGGISGDYSSLAAIGITTGEEFNASDVPHIELDEEVFREVLRENRENIAKLFANDGKTGVADTFYEYLDEATKVTGYLNQRVKSGGSIDRQIQMVNDQIDRMQDRLEMRETRLRGQFTQMEMMMSNYQSQSSSLTGLGGGF
jgi:flagellar hook-associated protein 2